MLKCQRRQKSTLKYCQTIARNKRKRKTSLNKKQRAKLANTKTKEKASLTPLLSSNLPLSLSQFQRTLQARRKASSGRHMPPAMSSRYKYSPPTRLAIRQKPNIQIAVQTMRIRSKVSSPTAMNREPRDSWLHLRVYYSS